ncbi:SRPBCC family protein [Confluentibacter citreus]|uniref:SRPBCC family protein n=1 Tax=Confluentibacter citreus TaxID=2007307 RepID=UPI000C283C63|nr:SRPBCC family protein [Confluentibacter citreus]
MGTIINQITINAPIDKIWEALSNVEELEKYDPTVEKCAVLSESKNGIGAKRKVTMKDGKNWFEEKCTVSKPNEALTYELTNCSFPVQNLNHSYTFEQNGNRTTVKQIMDYKVKFGFFGKILDSLVIRKQSDKGIKLFLSGLKSYTEN